MMAAVSWLTVTDWTFMWVGIAAVCLMLLLRATFYFYFKAKEEFVDRLVQKGKYDGKDK